MCCYMYMYTGALETIIADLVFINHFLGYIKASLFCKCYNMIPHYKTRTWNLKLTLIFNLGYIPSKPLMFSQHSNLKLLSIEKEFTVCMLYIPIRCIGTLIISYFEYAKCVHISAAFSFVDYSVKKYLIHLI